MSAGHAAPQRAREQPCRGEHPAQLPRDPEVDSPAPFEPAHRVQAERYAAAGHTCAPTGFTFVEVGDHEAVLEGWLGPGHGLPVRYAPGTGPGVHACGIATAAGEIVLR